MSSGASCAYANPRRASSSCSEDTPRSNSTPSTRDTPAAARTAGSWSYTAWCTETRSANGANRADASRSASGSRSIPTSRSPGCASSSATECPARPSVASTATAPGPDTAGASRASTRSRRTGTCVGVRPISRPPPDVASGDDDVPTRTEVLRAPRTPARSSASWHRGRGVREPMPAGRLTPGKRSQGTDRSGGRPRRTTALRRSMSQHSWQHLLRQLGERLLAVGQVGLPGRRVPDLDPGVGADDHAVLGQPRVLAQRRRHGDPALLVRHLVGGAGEEDPAVVPNRLLRHRSLGHRVGDPAELGHREHVEASLLPLGDHDALRQLVPELGRQEQPALVVEPWRVGAEEHGPTSARPVEVSYDAGGRPLVLHRAPPYPTSPHLNLYLPHPDPTAARFRNVTRTSDGGSTAAAGAVPPVRTGRYGERAPEEVPH